MRLLLLNFLRRSYLISDLLLVAHLSAAPLDARKLRALNDSVLPLTTICILLLGHLLVATCLMQESAAIVPIPLLSSKDDHRQSCPVTHLLRLPNIKSISVKMREGCRLLGIAEFALPEKYHILLLLAFLRLHQPWNKAPIAENLESLP